MTKPSSALSIIVVFVFCALMTANTVQAANFMFTHDLSLGSRSSDVSALQQFLIDGKFLAVVAPTGYFGPATKIAVGKWQTLVGINPPAGFFGKMSREKMNSLHAQASAPVSVAPTATNVSVVPGCTSSIGFSSLTGQSCLTGLVNTIIATGPSGSSNPAPTVTTTPPATTATTIVVSTNDGHPVRLQIPKLGVDAIFQFNGLKTDGTMEIPNNVTDVGWFTGSVKPGEKGTSVITGHVAQIRGGVITKPGVFSNLTELKAGDKLTVINDKGAVLTFVVRESRSYDPAADATDVFSARDNSSHMNIITCEGTWNPGQLSYSQRLVVFTDLVI